MEATCPALKKGITFDPETLDNPVRTVCSFNKSSGTTDIVGGFLDNCWVLTSFLLCILVWWSHHVHSKVEGSAYFRLLERKRMYTPESQVVKWGMMSWAWCHAYFYITENHFNFATSNWYKLGHNISPTVAGQLQEPWSSYICVHQKALELYPDNFNVNGHL